MYIEIKEGFKIRYDEYGKDNQRLVLFIHGLGSSPIVWRDIHKHYRNIFVQ
jgi:pimeloyl-ACP methyl ester carboxylesterase